MDLGIRERDGAQRERERDRQGWRSEVFNVILVAVTCYCILSVLPRVCGAVLSDSNFTVCMEQLTQLTVIGSVNGFVTSKA